MTGLNDDSPAVLKSDSTAATTTTITNNSSNTTDNSEACGKIKDDPIEVVPKSIGNGDDATQQAEPSSEATAKNGKSERDEKYNQFKNDPEKMQQMDEFVTGLLETAEKEAEIRMAAKKSEAKKGREGRSSIFNGMRRGRMLTRARTVVVRWFEVICNCTTSGNAPATSPLACNQGGGRPLLQKANTMAN